MSNLRYSLGVLSDPTVFAMGRLAPVSDHDTYASEAEASMDASSLSQSLNGRRNVAPPGMKSTYPGISSCRATAARSTSIRSIPGTGMSFYALRKFLPKKIR